MRKLNTIKVLFDTVKTEASCSLFIASALFVFIIDLL